MKKMMTCLCLERRIVLCVAVTRIKRAVFCARLLVLRKLTSKISIRRVCFLVLAVVILSVVCDFRFLLPCKFAENAADDKLLVSCFGSKGRTSFSRSVQTGQMATEGICWASRIERWIPDGIDFNRARDFIEQARQQRVISMEPGTTYRCGKAPNAYVTMTNNYTFCAKFSQSSNHSILGELFSFHLSQILGMDNVPPVLLSYVSLTPPSPWSDVIDRMTALQWSRDVYVALIGWIPDLLWKGSRVSIPPLIAEALTSGTTLTSATVSSHLDRKCSTNNASLEKDNSCLRETEEEFSRLAQWGTMVVFDYITGNYDRASSLPEGGSTVRNLQQTKDRKFWLFDNEAAFFRSYQLIHQGSNTGKQLQHSLLRHLRSTCIFQKSLVRHLTDFVKKGDPTVTLLDNVRMHEPLFERITVDADSWLLLVKMFSRRVLDVLDWLLHCHSLDKY